MDGECNVEYAAKRREGTRVTEYICRLAELLGKDFYCSFKSLSRAILYVLLLDAYFI